MGTIIIGLCPTIYGRSILTMDMYVNGLHATNKPPRGQTNNVVSKKV